MTLLNCRGQGHHRRGRRFVNGAYPNTLDKRYRLCSCCNRAVRQVTHVRAEYSICTPSQEVGSVLFKPPILSCPWLWMVSLAAGRH